MTTQRPVALFAAALTFFTFTLLAQSPKTVRGNVHPKAQLQHDRGRVAPSMKMSNMSVLLKRTPDQQAKLDQLLKDQHDPSSPQYHKWLTPEQFADNFGASQQDVDKLSQWLQMHGLTVEKTARGRDYITFSGTARQVESALGTEIHHFDADGKTHFANAAEPSVPEEFSGMIAGFRGLNDFRMQSPKRNTAFRGMKVAGTKPTPDFYSKSYPNTNVMAPDDLATIYNVNALYAQGIDGANQYIAIAGQTDIDMSDIEYFREAFQLPFRDPVKILVPGSTNPGITGDLGEADLDLEWSGAVARNATIMYVYSDDVVTSAFYAIDQDVAPVLSFSYGGCELGNSPNDVQALEQEAQKAASEGITWIASSGDAGAAGCESQNGSNTSATTRLSVNIPASLPHVTGVGGSEFNEGSGNYWASRLRNNGGSALSYIPERAWTDESLILQNGGSGFASTGGGASLYFGKPDWQAGPGVPSDGARDVPDVALTASWFHDPYALITGGEFVPNGGTSAAAPSFAGIVALLNQYMIANGIQSAPGLGHINPMLYSIAQKSPEAFHDVTSGTNVVPCVNGSSKDCRNGSMGYKAGAGYDPVTGLGSVDALALAQAWTKAQSGSPRLAVTDFTASTSVKAGGKFTLSLTVANQGNQGAGQFETQVRFTTNGDLASALSYYIYCDASGLAAGKTFTCAGSVTLSSSVKPGRYALIGLADANNSVDESDRSGNAAFASTGTLTVTQ